MTVIRTRRQAAVRNSAERAALVLVRWRLGRLVLVVAIRIANRAARRRAMRIIREFSC